MFKLYAKNTMDGNLKELYPGDTPHETYQSYVCKFLSKGFSGDILFKYYFRIKYGLHMSEKWGQLWGNNNNKPVKHGWFGVKC